MMIVLHKRGRTTSAVRAEIAAEHNFEPPYSVKAADVYTITQSRQRCMNYLLLACVISLAACDSGERPNATPPAAPAAGQDTKSSTTTNITAQKNEAAAVEIREPFNPAGCKSGSKEHIYFAAHDQVFKFRYDPMQPIYSRIGAKGSAALSEADLEEALPPPNPDELNGCHDNPLRSITVPYMDKFAEDLFKKLTGYSSKPYTHKVSYASIRSYSRNSSCNKIYEEIFLKIYNKHLSGKSLYEKLFDAKDKCVQRQSGMIECWEGESSRNGFLTGRMIKINGNQIFPVGMKAQDVYVSMQLGHFDVLGENQRMRYELEVDIYLFDNNLHIADRFEVNPEDVDMLIPYYREMIRYVADAHVPGYAWPAVKN